MSDIRRIRRQILGQTQTGLAKICKVGQPTVSRWERGIGGPKHVHLSRMRSFAIRTGIAWNDSDLFAPRSKRGSSLRSSQKERSTLTAAGAR